MQGDIYTALAEAVQSAGDISHIGVVRENGDTAVAFAGAEVVQRYFDGTRKEAVTFNITGMEADTRQESLVKGLCDTVERIKAASLTVEGFTQPRVRVTLLPVPIVHDKDTWIYSARIQVSGYVK